jgi:hypothetical protein
MEAAAGGAAGAGFLLRVSPADGEATRMDALEEVLEPGDDEKKDPLNNWVAITVVVIAAVMGLSAVKAGNIAQAMIQVKSDEVNRWAYFQAKSTKQNLAEVALDQIRLQRAAADRVTPAAAAAFAEKERFYAAEVARYEQEKSELKTEAEGLGKEYAALNVKDDQFDLSDAVLSLGLALLGVTALTHRRWLYWVAVAFASFGLVVSGAGLLNLNLHLAALTGWLGA